jgi:hypothetical protein
MSYAEEDTCHMRRRIHVAIHDPEVPVISAPKALSRGPNSQSSYEEEDTCVL